MIPIGGLNYPNTAKEFAEAIISYTEAIEQIMITQLGVEKNYSNIVKWGYMAKEVLADVSALHQMAQVYLRGEE